MKKYAFWFLLSGFFGFLTEDIQAQPLAQEGNRWHIAAYSWFANFVNTSIVRVGTDTVLDGTIWHKLEYLSNYNMPNEYWRHYGTYLREEPGGKVYHLDLTQSPDPRLLYDFSLEPGDSIAIVPQSSGYPSGCYATVVAVDSIALGDGSVRRRLLVESKLESGQSYATDYWIAGIGGHFGLTNPEWAFCYTDNSDFLLCFYQNETLVYPDNLPSCYLVSQREPVWKRDVKIWPNPFDDYLYIDAGTEAVSLRVFRPDGSAVWASHPLATQFSIELAGIPDGFYYLLITSANGEQAAFPVAKMR